LINASRGPIVDEQALISVLKEKAIAGAGDRRYSTLSRCLRLIPSGTLANVLATPHIGYVRMVI